MSNQQDRIVPRICVVGSANMDLIARVPRLPKLGETLQGRSFYLAYGGKGANQAVMAAKLGANVALVARVGKDVFGDGMLSHFRKHGINTSAVTIDDAHSSGVAPIFVDDQAQNVIVVIPGANGALSADDVIAARDVISTSQTVVCQLEVPIETTLQAFRIAKSAGVRTILNPAPAANLPQELFTLTDIFAPNETETEWFSGISIQSISDAEKAAHELRRLGVHSVIITLGERGVLYCTDETSLHVPAVRVSAIDPTGAGDAFIGSLAVTLAEGMLMEDALQYANTAAALSVTRIGAQNSFPSRDEVDAFMNARP